MFDPAEIAENLRQIVLKDPGSELDNRWKHGQALVADLDNEEWEALRKYVESKIVDHKDDQYSVQLPAWTKVLEIIKSVP